MNYVKYNGPGEQFGVSDIEKVPSQIGGEVYNIADESGSELYDFTRRGARGGERVLVSSEIGVLDVVEGFLTWKPWELFTHLAMIVLLVYTLYYMFNDRQARTVTNMLLLIIVINLSIQIHQNINIKKLLF